MIKYARNYSFFQKKLLKMVLFLSTCVKTNLFWRRVQPFLAILHLFYAQKWLSNCDKIRTKWQLFQKKALKMVLLLSTRVKKNVFWRMEQPFLAIMRLFYAQRWQSNCDQNTHEMSFLEKKHWKWTFCSLYALKRTFFKNGVVFS